MCVRIMSDDYVLLRNFSTNMIIIIIIIIIIIYIRAFNSKHYKTLYHYKHKVLIKGQ